MGKFNNLITTRYDVIGSTSAHVSHPQCQQLLSILSIIDVEKVGLTTDHTLTLETFITNGCSPTRTGEILALKSAAVMNVLYVEILPKLQEFANTVTVEDVSRETSQDNDKGIETVIENTVEENTKPRRGRYAGTNPRSTKLQELVTKVGETNLGSVLSSAEKEAVEFFLASNCNTKLTAEVLNKSVPTVYAQLFGTAKYKGALKKLEEHLNSGVTPNPTAPPQMVQQGSNMLQAPFKRNMSNDNYQRNKPAYVALIDALNKVDIYDLMYPQKGMRTIFSPNEMKVLKVFLDKDKGNLNPSLTSKQTGIQWLGQILYGRDGYAGQHTMTNIGILGKLNERLGRTNRVVS